MKNDSSQNATNLHVSTKRNNLTFDIRYIFPNAGKYISCIALPQGVCHSFLSDEYV